MSAFRTVSEPTLGESVLVARTANGLPLRVVASDRFRETTAVIRVGYGSTHLDYELDGAWRKSPEGVAHYLEHKLFEDEDLHVFERFGRRGAQVNAMTSFDSTTYYFSATSHVRENLEDLLRLVSRAHLTPENVDKERGIIEQELRMYEDSPEYRGFFELLRCFYREHPVRNPVGGTVESIQGIDVAELDACHRAFYRTGNASLAIAGPVDADEIFALASAWDLPAGDAPGTRPPAADDTTGNVQATRGATTMAVARPRVLLGFKDADVPDDAEARAVRELTTGIALDALFGAASDARERLHEDGTVDDSLSCSYMSGRGFGFTVLACETEQPDVVISRLHELLLAPSTVDETFLERARRRVLGRWVRSFESMQRQAFTHAEEELDGIEPFRGLARMQAVNVDDVLTRQAEHCVDDAFAAVVVEP